MSQKETAIKCAYCVGLFNSKCIPLYYLAVCTDRRRGLNGATVLINAEHLQNVCHKLNH